MKHGKLLIFHKENVLWDVSGFSKLNINLTVQLKDSRQYWSKGYTQSYGIDYQEKFAPVAKLNTIRILLSLAVNLDWPLLQLDVKNTFLNVQLEEEVYMDNPEGFRGISPRNKVCKLKRSLYGLKQSPKSWFDRFLQVLKSHQYKQCQADHTLFTNMQLMESVLY